jgi:uncharacterized membrane protein
MNKFLIITFGVASSMLLMDIIWLSVMSKNRYRPYLGDMIAEKFRLVPAVIFYLIYVLGLVYFVSLPAARQMSLSDSIINGGLFGAIAYSTYDLTNFATLRKWSLMVTLVDIGWGIALSSIASSCGYLSWVLLS